MVTPAQMMAAKIKYIFPESYRSWKLISQILRSLTHCATFECETYAVLKAFEAADLYAEENGGQTFSRKVSIHLDNLEAKLTLETSPGGARMPSMNEY